ncbi:hypothetical protein ACJX0J_005182 [Zea mays]
MGQKINPLGFRLGTTQNHHSFWFAQPKNYSEGLQEDKKIRNCIKNYIQKNRKKGSNRKMESDSSSEVITHIEIQKEIDTIHVIIHIGFPNLLKKKGAIEELEKDLQKEVNSVNQRLNIAIEKVKEPYRQPNILAEYIAFQLKNRVSFRKAMKKAIELTKKADIKGIKIQIAGLLGVKIWIFNLKSFNIIAMLSHQYNKILKKKREFEISKSKKPNFFYYILIFRKQHRGRMKENPAEAIIFVLVDMLFKDIEPQKGIFEDKKPLWSSKIDRYARIGDVIIAVIKDAVPQMPLERSEVIRAVIVRTRKEFKGDDGIIIRYDDNAAVIIDQKGNPKGTRVFGAFSLAPEILSHKRENINADMNKKGTVRVVSTNYTENIVKILLREGFIESN